MFSKFIAPVVILYHLGYEIWYFFYPPERIDLRAGWWVFPLMISFHVLIALILTWRSPRIQKIYMWSYMGMVFLGSFAYQTGWVNRWVHAVIVVVGLPLFVLCLKEGISHYRRPLVTSK